MMATTLDETRIHVQNYIRSIRQLEILGLEQITINIRSRKLKLKQMAVREEIQYIELS
jgi:hypothetical protein